MTEQEAQAKVDEYNEAATYGEGKEVFNEIIHDLADEGYGVAWNGDEYVLTNVPDLSMLAK
jgi:hypothetical protein